MQVIAFAALVHLSALPMATAAWVHLAAAALNILACCSACAAALEGQPWLQHQYAAAAALMQRATSAAALPEPALPAAGARACTPADPAAALGACCALRAFAWLASGCLSLWLLYRREVSQRLAWARRQRWPAERLVQQLRWLRAPLWTAAAELVLALCLAWRVAALLILM